MNQDNKEIINKSFEEWLKHYYKEYYIWKEKEGLKEKKDEKNNVDN